MKITLHWLPQVTKTDMKLRWASSLPQIASPSAMILNRFYDEHHERNEELTLLAFVLPDTLKNDSSVCMMFPSFYYRF
ncbi:hypothetical protein [Pseudocitrobacter faecalis]|uniref:hypothetical protein n=1 Tax=Pseudocitrobacter faecalis TaxID=1398493 RepID=UPI003B9E4D74